MPINRIILPFAPREWQIPLIEDRKRSMVAVVHRRAGKSTAFVWRGLKKALTEDRAHIPERRRNLTADPPRVVHVLPAQVMWQRTGLWDKVARAAEMIPGAVAFKSVLRVELPNGGIYQCGGMDKPDSWRGGYADEVVEDEADDVIASGLDMVVEPMLADYSGSRIKIGTPKGNGRLAAAYDAAGHDDNSSRYLLPWQETGALDTAQVQRLRETLDEEEFAQELECSFNAPNSGSYYGRWLDDAMKQDRITRVPMTQNCRSTPAGIWVWTTTPRSGGSRDHRAANGGGWSISRITATVSTTTRRSSTRSHTSTRATSFRTMSRCKRWAPGNHVARCFKV